ncbi:hypothetical protein BGZ93_005555 [Podila epicladia]|nr:hypothetical protein BGZ92_001583 [Podila epicladia]KAG0095698.1 hypothetical protein BGZ93_005555 [Podila epicladia]
MFSITELNELMCRQLDRRSLVQCAKVNKKWSAAITPIIWHTIPEGIWHRNWRSFCHLVLEDFLKEQQNLKDSQKPPPTKKAGQSTQAVASLSAKRPKSNKNALPLALAKYGGDVRHVECSAELLLGLEHVRSSKGELRLSGRSPGPSALDLVRHFLKRCPNALMDLEVGNKFFNSPEMFRLAMEVMPRVINLSIRGDHDRRKVFPASKFMQALTAASDNLQSLTLDFLFFRHGKAEDANDTPEPVMTARPKRLHIRKMFDPTGCEWLWQACGQVQVLDLHDISELVYVSVALAVRESMSSLDTVIFGDHRESMGDYHLSDEKVMLIIESGTKGWKAIHCGSIARFGLHCAQSLCDQAATLEELTATRVEGPIGIVAILKFSPKLRTCKIIDESVSGRGLAPKIPATDFIDWGAWHHKSWTIQPWACKDTLETLAINFTQRDHHGELEDDWCFCKTQQQVCEQLGTFKNLKILQLAPKGYRDVRQEECLHLTLEMGLDKLAGLKNLEEFYIANMDHRVGMREVKWMIKSWPKLSKLYGLPAHTTAAKWLKANHPKIRQSD